MLTEERFAEITQLVNMRGSVTVQELTKVLNTSESTIRRDLTKLHQMKKLVKVHGGATAIHLEYTRHDVAVASRKSLYMEDKKRIGQYAASLIEKEDFVYLDAGTSTDCLIDHLRHRETVFVTNAIAHAQRLIREGYKVYLTGGEVKQSTEAIVGEEALHSLEKYHFTKGFFGTNGIDKENGYTTPDISEALVKEKAMEHCQKVYVLADVSKFGQTAPVHFGDFEQATVLTTHLGKTAYKKQKNVKEITDDDLHSNF